MKKLRLLKQDKEVAVSIEQSVYCDFCGEPDKQVVTSAFDDSLDSRKCEMQICFDCIKQLNKLSPHH